MKSINIDPGASAYASHHSLLGLLQSRASIQADEGPTVGNTISIQIEPQSAAVNQSSCCGGGSSSSPAVPATQPKEARKETKFSSPSASPPSPQKEKKLEPTSKQSLDKVVMLQHADGSWTLDAAFASVLGLQLPQVTQANPVKSPVFWATALAIVWLERYHAESRDVWVLLSEKGFEFLATCKEMPPKQIIQQAKQLFV